MYKNVKLLLYGGLHVELFLSWEQLSSWSLGWFPGNQTKPKNSLTHNIFTICFLYRPNKWHNMLIGKCLRRF